MTDEEKAKFTVIEVKDREFGQGGYHTTYFSRGSFYDKMQDKLNMEKTSEEKTVEMAKEAFGI